MIPNIRKSVIPVFLLVLLMVACGKDDNSGAIDRERQRLDSIENSMNTIVRQLQSLVYVPESGSDIHLCGTDPVTLWYRVEPKRLATKLADHRTQLSFESKAFTATPSLTVTQASGDNDAGVLTLTVQPSDDFVVGGDYAFALVFSEDGTSFVSAYVPVTVEADDSMNVDKDDDTGQEDAE